MSGGPVPRGRMLPLRDEERQLLPPSPGAHGSHVFRLAWGPTVGLWLPGERALVKRISPVVHGYRGGAKRNPGVGVNVELVATAERFLPDPPLTVRLEAGPGRYEVAFPVLVAFAWAAVDGDWRYRLTDDRDLQVLVPWPVWRGELSAPPPASFTGRARRPPPEPYAGPSLFEEGEL